jgi:hypothetical protein
MKLQRYVTNDGVMPPGTWVKSSDAEALELAVERATANMVAAQNRAAELEKALREMRRCAATTCEYCHAIATEALEAK